MAEEPQPPTVHKGAEDPPALPANAEDRKAAAALSSLDARDEDEGATKGKDVDTEALGKAMKSLDVKDSGKKADTPAKKVKIEATDVSLLVDQLDLSKTKATELLKAHDGDAVKAMTAFVTAPA